MATFLTIAVLPHAAADECLDPCYVTVPVQADDSTYYIDLRPTTQGFALYEEANDLPGLQRGGCASQNERCEAAMWIDEQVKLGRIEPDSAILIL